MKKAFNYFILIISMCAMLTACGGGGSGVIPPSASLSPSVSPSGATSQWYYPNGYPASVFTTSIGDHCQDNMMVNEFMPNILPGGTATQLGVILVTPSNANLKMALYDPNGNLLQSAATTTGINNNPTLVTVAITSTPITANGNYAVAWATDNTALQIRAYNSGVASFTWYPNPYADFPPSSLGSLPWNNPAKGVAIYITTGEGSSPSGLKHQGGD